MGGRTQKLFKETIWFAIGNFGSKILSLLLVPLYTNILTTREYGVIDIIFTTINISIPILTLTIQDGVFRFAMDKGCNRKEIASGGLFITLAAFPVLLLLYPLFMLMLPQITDYWVYFVSIFLINSLVGTVSYYLKGTNKSTVYAIQGIVYTLVFAVSNIVFLVVLQWRVDGYLFSMLLANVVSLFFLICAGGILKDFSLKYLNKAVVLEMVKYCIPLIPATVAWWIMTSIDKYMLLYMCGTSETGIYSVAHKIPAIISTLTSFFINAWQISSVRNKDDEDNSEYSSKVFQVLLISGFVMTFVLIQLSEPIGKLFFAKEFYVAWKMTPCLTAGTVISVFAGFIGAQFTAEKRTDLHLKSNVLAMVSNIILNFILIKLFDMNGAVYGTMISYFVVFVYRLVKVESFMHFSYHRAKLYAALLVLMLSAVTTSFDIPYYYFVNLGCFAVMVCLYYNDLRDMIKTFADYAFNILRLKNK